jgi:hypothetical protein
MKFNISSMCKWWWKLEDGEGPWKDFMWKKYLRHGGIFSANHKQKESALWSDMLHIKDSTFVAEKCKWEMVLELIFGVIVGVGTHL